MSAIIIDPNRPKSLALETCRANAIDNERLYEISPSETNSFRDFDRDYGGNVHRRSNPTPHYNCHGLTFASRRTGIFENEVLQQILRDDGYLEVARDSVLPGDVILYFDEYGGCEHSGIVISRPQADNLYVPWVCSKWGKYAELLHLANDCPYSFANVKYYRVHS